MPTKRPNIVLIHTDQQRGDCLSIAGHPHLLTPQLDALACSGARFSRAYTECPICIPARHTVLTGMSPSASGVVGFAMHARIQREEATLPNLLRHVGYQTANIGRGWHTHPGYKRYGFETVMPYPPKEFYSKFNDLPQVSQHPSYFMPHYQEHGLGPNSFTARPWHLEERFHDTNYAVNRAIECIDNRDKEAPLFMTVGFTAPHPPLIPPRDYLERYLQMELEPPVCGDWCTPPERRTGYSDGHGRPWMQGELMRRAMAAYFGLINHVDDQLLLLLHRLELEKEPTYILFIADHGEMLGDHGFWRKSLPYEGAAHIPFLVSGPGIDADTVIDKPVGLQDVLPTCCEMAEIDVPDHVTGRSVLGLTRGEGDWRPFIQGEHAPMGDQHPGMHYLTDGRWKYVWFNDGTEQLFDLESDPRECHDLAGDPKQAAQAEMWRSRLVDLLKDRPEGFSDGRSLIPGRDYGATIPGMHD